MFIENLERNDRRFIVYLKSALFSEKYCLRKWFREIIFVNGCFQRDGKTSFSRFESLVGK